MNGCLLSKEQVGAIQGQVTVHFVGGDLVVALDAVLAAGVHQHLGAQDVGLQEDLGILDGAVHVALGGEVHHHIGFFFLEELITRR